MTALVVGASSGLGRALAAELARRKRDLLLVASDLRDLAALASDLRLREGINVRVLALDLAREPEPGQRIADALDGMTPLEAALLAAGWSREDDDLSLDAARIGQLLAVNLHAPVAIAHALLPALLATRGVIVLFGSIAAARGRGRNVVYSASKRALVSFHESLRQRYRPRELRVQLYQLGFLATNLTFGRRMPLRSERPEVIAKVVVDRLTRASGCWYLPRHFALVSLLLRALPWSVYRRLRD